MQPTGRLELAMPARQSRVLRGCRTSPSTWPTLLSDVPDTLTDSLEVDGERWGSQAAVARLVALVTSTRLRDSISAGTTSVTVARGPTSYCVWDKRWFQSKIVKKNSHPVYFTPPLTRFPLEFGVGAYSEKLDWWCYRTEKVVRRYFQPSGYNTSTWQTDNGRQQWLRSRIASRGINVRRPRIKWLLR